jgi:hypothetical protein
MLISGEFILSYQPLVSVNLEADVAGCVYQKITIKNTI